MKDIDPPDRSDLLEVLAEFIVTVVQEQPCDLVSFAAAYFASLSKSSRDAQYTTAEPNGKGDDEEMKAKKVPVVQSRSRRQAVAGESFDPTKTDECEVDIVVHPKTQDQLSRLKDAVSSILIFKACDRDDLNKILDAMFLRSVEPGEYIIRQGQEGNHFYVVDQGTYEVFVNQGGVEKKVGEIVDRGSFGELALLYNCPRAATIVATQPGSLWCLDQVTFRRTIVTSKARTRQQREDFIQRIPILAPLTSGERMCLADALETEVFAPGNVIIQQGDRADKMYFIERGEVKILVKKGGSNIEVARSGAGDYFGEMALIMKQPRSASVIAVTEVKSAVLEIGAFERLLGPCLDIMRRNMSNYDISKLVSENKS